MAAKGDDSDDTDGEQANIVTAADATGDDSTDAAGHGGAKKKQAQDAAAVQAASKASKTDPLLQALATPTKAANVHAASADDDDKDDTTEKASATALKKLLPRQKKTPAATGKAVSQTKPVQKTDDADDAEQAQDSDDTVNQADDADSTQQTGAKHAKSKVSGLGADDDIQPALGAAPAAKPTSEQTNQLTAAQQQASDDAAAAAAAASTTTTPQDLSSDAPAPSDPGSSAVTSIDHLTALATDLASTSATPGKAAVNPTATQTAKADGSTGTQAFMPPEVQFAESNHAKIVSGVQGQLLPGGGTMQIRLDPPELGALQVSVHMQNGVMSATFQTSNDDATKVLSHSLSQLKAALEAQGVTVDKLHVQQSPRDQKSNADDQQKNQSPSEQSQQKQEQQRREMLQRMWKRLTNGSDPLDMVA